MLHTPKSVDSSPLNGKGCMRGPVMNQDPDWGSCGTVAFVAPEQFVCLEQTVKVDIWALGKIIVLIIFEWSCGWQLLWSPNFLEADEIRSLGPLVKLLDLLKDMIKVSYKFTCCYPLDILFHSIISI